MTAGRRSPAGVVVAAHGVKGLVRVKTFTETPASLDAYGDLTDAAGEARYRVKVVEARDTVAIARIDGVADRSAAERLKGLTLYLDRAALPEAEPEEFFHADLVGLPVERAAARGARIGEVAALYDYGAGELIEVALDAGGAPLVLPFTAAAVPVIDLAAGVVAIDPPPGLEPPPGKRDAERRDAPDPEEEGERT
ncbi:MAG: ribosome maturation factor RimM [Alphaproteobacteria bacterium]